MPVSIQFLGGAGTVTGSKFLLDCDGRRILVDCGLFQGLKDLRLKNWQPLPVDPATIDCVLLTHAHLDHCGYLPLLTKQGFSEKIYCSQPTLELARILLMDSAKIQEEDAALANRMGYSKHRPAEPLYKTSDVEICCKLFSGVDTAEWFPLWDGVKFRFTPSGHIVGSVFVEIDIKGLKVVFSGDLGRKEPLVLNPPQPVHYAHHLVVESTYGDRFHEFESPLRSLAKIVNQTAQRMGHLIIPSFAALQTRRKLGKAYS